MLGTWWPVTAALLLLSLALLFYGPYLGWLPRGIHEWAQADRLALALSFYDFGFDFWHPRTLSLHSIDGITGVEFPLFPYIAALLGGVFGREAISPAFRLLTLITSVAGCYCAFRLVYDSTGKGILAMLPGVFLLSSPAFVYYSGNYLSDTAGASLALVGIYTLVKAARLQTGISGMMAGLAVLTLAALVKLSAALYLAGAVVGIGLYLLERPVRPTAQQWLALAAAVLCSGACLLSYVLYTRHLNATYHSTLFLAEPRPVTSAETAAYIWIRIRDVWWPEYLTMPASLVLGLAVAFLLLYTRRNWRRYRPLLGAGLTVMIGGLAFFALMGAQFIDHDYYVLAPYAPLAVLLVAAASYGVAQRSWKWSNPAATVVIIMLVAAGWHRHTQRMQEPYGNFSNYYSYHWMVGASPALDRAHVPREAQVLVVGEEEAPNLALIYLDRRGIVWRADLAAVPETELLQRMREKNLQYLVMSQRAMLAFRPAHPKMTESFRLISSTPNLVIYQPRSLPAPW